MKTYQLLREWGLSGVPCCYSEFLSPLPQGILMGIGQRHMKNIENGYRDFGPLPSTPIAIPINNLIDLILDNYIHSLFQLLNFLI